MIELWISAERGAALGIEELPRRPGRVLWGPRGLGTGRIYDPPGGRGWHLKRIRELSGRTHMELWRMSNSTARWLVDECELRAGACDKDAEGRRLQRHLECTRGSLLRALESFSRAG